MIKFPRVFPKKLSSHISLPQTSVLRWMVLIDAYGMFTPCKQTITYDTCMHKIGSSSAIPILDISVLKNCVKGIAPYTVLYGFTANLLCYHHYNKPLNIKQSPSVDVCFNLFIPCNCMNVCVYAIISCCVPWDMVGVSPAGISHVYIVTSALVSMGQITILRICLLLKLAPYKNRKMPDAEPQIHHYYLCCMLNSEKSIHSKHEK